MVACSHVRLAACDADGHGGAQSSEDRSVPDHEVRTLPKMSTPESSRIARQEVLELPSLLYLERYRNEGTRNYSRHAAY